MAGLPCTVGELSVQCTGREKYFTHASKRNTLSPVRFPILGVFDPAEFGPLSSTQKKEKRPVDPMGPAVSLFKYTQKETKRPGTTYYISNLTPKQTELTYQLLT